MSNYTHYKRCKRRKESTLRRCAAMRAAKEAQRLARAQGFSVIRFVTICDADHQPLHQWEISASADGRHLSIQTSEGITICGAERTVRSAISKSIWKSRNTVQETP